MHRLIQVNPAYQQIPTTTQLCHLLGQATIGNSMMFMVQGYFMASREIKVNYEHFPTKILGEIMLSNYSLQRQAKANHANAMQ